MYIIAFQKWLLQRALVNEKLLKFNAVAFCKIKYQVINTTCFCVFQCTPFLRKIHASDLSTGLPTLRFKLPPVFLTF